MEYGCDRLRSQIPVVVSLLRYANAEPEALQSVRRRFRLTPTQARVAALLADRLTNDEIAHELGIKPSTARRHTEAVLLRMDVNSRFKVVAKLAEVIAERAKAS